MMNATMKTLVTNVGREPKGTLTIEKVLNRTAKTDEVRLAVMKLRNGIIAVS